MSSEKMNTDDKFNLLLDKILSLENAIKELGSDKKTTSKKNKVLTFTRGEKKISSINILPFESNDQTVKICLIGTTTDSDVAYVISIAKDEFSKLAEKVVETDIGKTVKIYNYKGEDDPAMLIDGEWQLVG